MTNWRCSHAELHRVSTIGCMYTACAVCARIAAPCVRLYGRFPGMHKGLLQNRIVIFGPLARCFSLGFRRVSVLTLALSMWAFRRLCPSCHASLSVRTPADFHRRERPLCAELLRDTRTAALCTDALALRKACRAVRQSSQTALVFPSRQNRCRCGRSVSRPMCSSFRAVRLWAACIGCLFVLARPHAGFASRSPCASSSTQGLPEVCHRPMAKKNSVPRRPRAGFGACAAFPPLFLELYPRGQRARRALVQTLRTG